MNSSGFFANSPYSMNNDCFPAEVLSQYPNIGSGSCVQPYDYETKLQYVEGNCMFWTIERFSDAKFDLSMLENVQKMNFTQTTHVQSLVIPAILNKHEVLAISENGTGKTASFLLPIIDQLIKDPNSSRRDQICEPEVLILSPTNELAHQTHSFASKFCHNTGIRSAALFSKSHADFDWKKLNGTNILSGSAHRVLNFVTAKIPISLRQLKYLILDEFDQLMKTRDEVDAIFEHTKRQLGADNFAKLKTLMFTAMISPTNLSLSKLYVKEHVYILTQPSIEGLVNPDILQLIYLVLSEQDKAEIVFNFLRFHPEKTMVFVQNRATCIFLADYLAQQNLSVTYVCGDQWQTARERELCDFGTGRKNILVTTPILERGIDLCGVKQVINYDMPSSAVAYVNRIGRTGRLGTPGVSLSLFDPQRDRAMCRSLISILRGTNQFVPNYLLLLQ